MKTCRRLCIITDGFPEEGFPVNSFLEQLVFAFVDQGIACDVVSPNTPVFNRLKKIPYHPKAHSVRTTKQGNTFDLYCPAFFSLMGRKRFGINFLKLYQKSFYRATMRWLRRANKPYDALYAHFITPSALTAAKIGRKTGTPVFFAYGDSSFDEIRNIFPVDTLREQLKTVRGVIAVSSKNRSELVDHHVIEADKIEVFLNAIDRSTFYVTDRSAARKALGIDPDAFVVCFVGHFNHRKGSCRVSQAIDRLDGVKSMFIGAGGEAPDCDGILFSGRLPHDKIVTYLNAADAFVLPTLAEGCCNAIIEAMACGLPIISSDLPFNDDILDASNSIRINPNSIEDIAGAIGLLQHSPETRRQLSQGALRSAQALTIDKRAENILAFMNRRCAESPGA
ncbi:MAG: glycosyltransferase [Firmicutes bacterium]|nr:glycosyltransferase [Bacillota bacterium]